MAKNKKHPLTYYREQTEKRVKNFKKSLPKAQPGTIVGKNLPFTGDENNITPSYQPPINPNAQRISSTEAMNMGVLGNIGQNQPTGAGKLLRKVFPRLYGLPTRAQMNAMNRSQDIPLGKKGGSMKSKSKAKKK